MNRTSTCFALLVAVVLDCSGSGARESMARETATEPESREFQSQELIPSRAGAWLFPFAKPPRVVWRDTEMVSRLGGPVPPVVRWFDASLRESQQPDKPGRWMAWVEGKAPNGRPLRRAFTFFAVPDKFDVGAVPDLTIALPHFPATGTPAVVREYQAEIEGGSKELFTRAIADSERVAILVSAISEATSLDRPRRFTESSLMAHAERHLALKLKLLGSSDRVRPVSPPVPIEEDDVASSVVAAGHPFPEAERAKRRIDEFCRQWADATGEPFVTMVIADDHVITHEAFGASAGGTPVDVEYRCWIASLTKTVTGLMFARFVD